MYIMDHEAMRRKTCEEAREEEENDARFWKQQESDAQGARLGDLDDELIHAASRKASREWPPRWAQPVVVGGVIGYSVMFLNA